MNLERAINKFQIPYGVKPTDEYLKKRYRFIAKKIHPDKFTNPREKLLAHQDFLELQDAYEYLKSLNLDERFIITESPTNDFENEINDSDNNYESEYIVEKKPYDWIYIFLIPGAIIFHFIVSFLMVIYLVVIDFGKKSKSKTENIINLILNLIFGAIPILIMFGVLMFYGFKELKNGNWILWFIVIEFILVNLYMGITFIIRKFFSRKIKTDLIIDE